MMFIDALLEARTRLSRGNDTAVNLARTSYGKDKTIIASVHLDAKVHFHRVPELIDFLGHDDWRCLP